METDTYEWLKKNQLEFIHEHVKDLTIDDFVNLTGKELDEFIQSNDGLSKQKIRDKLRFKASIRRLRRTTLHPNNDEDNAHHTQFPIEKMQQHRKAIPDYCEYKLTLVVIGATRVGKSSIIHQFVNDRFNYDMAATVGLDFFSTVVWLANDERAFLKILDMSGDERFDSYNCGFLKSADCIIVVYDITNKESYDLIESRFFPLIDNNCAKENVCIMIVGNKQDLRKTKPINKNNNNKNEETGQQSNRIEFIPIEHARAFVHKQNGMKNGGSKRDDISYRWGFSEVTAQSNIQVREIFQRYAELSRLLVCMHNLQTETDTVCHQCNMIAYIIVVKIKTYRSVSKKKLDKLEAWY